MTRFSLAGISSKVRTCLAGAVLELPKLAVKKVKLHRWRQCSPHHCASATCDGRPVYLRSPTTGPPMWAKCKRIWCRRPVMMRSLRKLQAVEAWAPWTLWALKCWETVSVVREQRPIATSLGLCWSRPNQWTGAFTWSLGGSQAWHSTM